MIMEVEGDRGHDDDVGPAHRDSEFQHWPFLVWENHWLLYIGLHRFRKSCGDSRSISHHINGGGGGSPTMAQGGGSNSDGIPASLDSAREFLGL